MPRHPSDPGLDYLYSEPDEIAEYDHAIDRADLRKDEFPPDVMDEFDAGGGE